MYLEGISNGIEVGTVVTERTQIGTIMKYFGVENIYNLINDYSNLERQKKEWLGLVPNIVSSYDEMIMMLFDDNDFDDFILQWEKNGFDNRTLKEMILFKDMLMAYNSQFSHQNNKYFDKAILKDPNWAEVTDQAKKVIDVWKYEQ